MSGLCLSSTANTTNTFTSLLFSAFTLFWSSLISHPLHFLLLILLSPYLLKLLSFLSPLLITTSLLLFALLTILNDNFFTQGKVGFLQSCFHALLHKLHPKINNEVGDQDFRSEQALQVYKSVFESSVVVVEENHPEEKILRTVESSVTKVNVEIINKPVILQESGRFEVVLSELVDMNDNCRGDLKKVEPPPMGCTKPDKPDRVVEEMSRENKRGFQQPCQTDPKEKFRRQKALSSVECVNNGGEYTYGSSRSMDCYDLGSYGSMRKEKEWKRTLACKLFEERHKNGDGDEGMDLLWETYEMESSSTKANAAAKTDAKTKKKKKKIEESKSNGEIQQYADEYDHKEEEEQQEEDDEDEIDKQKLCCLQAFKLSAGKMNMGVGKRNLVRFSKAVKGFGWLHHVSKLRKKVHNGDSF